MRKSAPVPKPSVAQLLRIESERFDRLIAEVELGPRDQRQFDALEERAQGISGRIRAAFRGAR